VESVRGGARCLWRIGFEKNKSFDKIIDKIRKMTEVKKTKIREKKLKR